MLGVTRLPDGNFTVTDGDTFRLCRSGQELLERTAEALGVHDWYGDLERERDEALARAEAAEAALALEKAKVVALRQVIARCVDVNARSRSESVFLSVLRNLLCPGYTDWAEQAKSPALDEWEARFEAEFAAKLEAPPAAPQEPVTRAEAENTALPSPPVTKQSLSEAAGVLGPTPIINVLMSGVTRAEVEAIAREVVSKALPADGPIARSELLAAVFHAEPCITCAKGATCIMHDEVNHSTRAVMKIAEAIAREVVADALDDLAEAFKKNWGCSQFSVVAKRLRGQAEGGCDGE